MKAKMRTNTEITTANDATTLVDETVAEVTTVEDDVPLLDRDTYRKIKATPHKDRLTAQHIICLHLFRHLAQFLLAIHTVSRRRHCTI